MSNLSPIIQTAIPDDVSPKVFYQGLLNFGVEAKILATDNMLDLDSHRNFTVHQLLGLFTTAAGNITGPNDFTDRELTIEQYTFKVFFGASVDPSINFANGRNYLVTWHLVTGAPTLWFFKSRFRNSQGIMGYTIMNFTRRQFEILNIPPYVTAREGGGSLPDDTLLDAICDFIDLLDTCFDRYASRRERQLFVSDRHISVDSDIIDVTTTSYIFVPR